MNQEGRSIIEENADVAQERTLNDTSKKASIKKAFPLILAIIVLAVGGYYLANYYIIPEGKYKQAAMLVEVGDFDTAIAAFNDLGNYRDSREQVTNVNQLKQEAIRKEEEANRNLELQKGRDLLNRDKFKEAMEIFDTYNSSEDIELTKEKIIEKSEDDIYKLEVNLISKNYLAYLQGLKDVKDRLNEFKIDEIDNDIKTKWDFAVSEYAPNYFDKELAGQSFYDDQYFKLVNTTKTKEWAKAKKNQSVRFSLGDTIGVFIDCKRSAGRLILCPVWYQLNFNEKTLKFDKIEAITAHEPTQLPSLGGYSWFIYSFWFEDIPFNDTGLYFVDLIDKDAKSLAKVYFIIE